MVYEAVGPAASSTPRRSRVARVISAAALALFACAALITLLGAATEQGRSELYTITPNQALDKLALEFLKHGATMSVQDMESKLSAWHNSPATLLDMATHVKGLEPTQMLALGPKSILADGSLLCAKKDLILSKFDDLLKKLGGQELSANITMDKVAKEFKQTMQAWLDSESEYRLDVQKAKDALEGATFARNAYEKWETANKQARSSLESILASHAVDRKAAEEERDLIRMIMRYIGILDDVDLSDASKAAGGRESTKDSTGVSSKYAKVAAELKAKLAKLKQVALKTKVPGAMQKLDMIEQKFAHTSQLPVYSETEEVAAILKDMLSDLENRLKVYDQVDSAAEKLVEDTQAKMVQWQTELVALSNAADKAKEKQMSAQLEREKLNGDKKVADSTYKEEKGAYKLLVPPYQREIYVITMIKVKINEHCEQSAAV